MEKLMNKIMHTGIVIISLTGFIACSELEAIKPKASGKPTFSEPTSSGGGSTPAGTVDVCALDPSLLEDGTDLSLQAMEPQNVTLLRSTQLLLHPYGVDLSCFTNTFTGPVFEVVKAKFKIHDLKAKKVDFLLSINIHEIDKTYYFDSKNAISTDLVLAQVSVGGINSQTFDPATAIIGTELNVDFEYDKHVLMLTLTKTDVPLNIWQASIVIYDKELGDDDSDEGNGNYYVLGTFDVSLDNTSL